MPKRQNKKARESNVQVFGSKFEECASAGDYKRLNKTLPKSKTDINRVVSHVCSDIETSRDSTSVSKVHLDVFRKLYDIGNRQNIQYLDSFVCKHNDCKTLSKIVCQECGKEQKLDILDSSAERNSIASLTIIMNKLFANKAPIANTFDEVEFVDRIAEFVGKVISILPPEHQKTYTELWIKTISEIENGE